MGKDVKDRTGDLGYNNVEQVEMLEDGTASVLLKEGRRAVIEIIRAGEKFEAAIYRSVFGGPEGQEPRRKSVMAKLGKHTAYNEALKEAVGWVDENPAEFELEEYKEPGKR